MAKKKASKKTRSKRRPPAQRKSGLRATQPLTDDERARIWVLAEEGLSYRQIKDDVGVSITTIHKVLHADPARLQTLINEQKQERAKLWKQLENATLRQLVAHVGELEKILLPKGKRRNRVLTAAQDNYLGHVKGLLNPLRLAADASTRKHELLTGQPTDRLHQSPGSELDASATEEDVIRAAIREEATDLLPPALKAKVGDVKKRMEEEEDG